VFSRGQPWIVVTALAAMLLLEAMHAHAEVSVEEFAKLTQNPVGNRTNMPFQNISKLSCGPDKTH
jgi:hypothetical protein